jgi:glucose-6-phosphate isomerase
MNSRGYSRSERRNALFIISSKPSVLLKPEERASFESWYLEGRTEEKLIATSLLVTPSSCADFGTVKHFPMWDWVGGSWSAIGLPILAIGIANFRELLSGAYAMTPFPE